MLLSVSRDFAQSGCFQVSLVRDNWPGSLCRKLVLTAPVFDQRHILGITEVKADKLERKLLIEFIQRITESKPKRYKVCGILSHCLIGVLALLHLSN